MIKTLKAPFADQFNGGIDWGYIYAASNAQIKAYTGNNGELPKSVCDFDKGNIYLHELVPPHIPMWVYLGPSRQLPVLWIAKIEMPVYDCELIRKELLVLLAQEWDEIDVALTAFPMCLLTTNAGIQAAISKSVCPSESWPHQARSTELHGGALVEPQ